MNVVQIYFDVSVRIISIIRSKWGWGTPETRFSNPNQTIPCTDENNARVIIPRPLGIGVGEALQQVQRYNLEAAPVRHDTNRGLRFLLSIPHQTNPLLSKPTI